MARKWLTATVTAALCISSATPALAQDYRFTGFDAPQGATATVNLRIPLTRVPRQRQRPTFGFTVGLSRSSGSADLDGSLVTRSANFADIRFTGDGELQQARLASFDLANLDRDRRLNMMGGTGAFTLIGIAATGVAICWLVVDCLGDDNDDEDENAN